MKAWALLALLLTGCSAKELRLADRHGLSFQPVATYAQSHPGTTLVLFDYHHDSGFGPGDLVTGSSSSYNWVGTLVDRGLVTRVLWISGNTLLLPNKNARAAWLRRLTASLPPQRQQRILDRVVLTDAADLLGRQLEGPVVASLDLDLFTKDPGEPPEDFLDQIGSWMRRQNPDLITVALSSAYQADPLQAWAWLERLVVNWPADDRNWILDLGPHDNRPESLEETLAWDQWSRRPSAWRPAVGHFRPGAGVWLAAPPSVRAALAGRLSAGGPDAASILAAWKDPDLVPLEQSLEAKSLEIVAGAADQALVDVWQGKAQPLAPAGNRGLGLAIRLHDAGHDRGCLALWTGVVDALASARYAAQEASRDPRYPPVSEAEALRLTLQPALFGPWRPMQTPTDFVVGFHSIMVVHAGDRTLIQAPLALERGWDAPQYLDALIQKAGLEPGAWRRPGLTWFRSVTLWGEAPVTRPK